MIIGLGIDLVELDRIRRSLDRFGCRFINKILHESEQDILPDPLDTGDKTLAAHIVARVAARFAAKEAGSKALGTGFAEGIGPRDIRVRSLPSGRPAIEFHGQALERARAMRVTAAHLSLTHARDTACAVVVLESEPGTASGSLPEAPPSASSGTDGAKPVPLSGE